MDTTILYSKMSRLLRKKRDKKNGNIAKHYIT